MLQCGKLATVGADQRLIAITIASQEWASKPDEKLDETKHRGPLCMQAASNDGSQHLRRA